MVDANRFALSQRVLAAFRAAHARAGDPLPARPPNLPRATAFEFFLIFFIAMPIATLYQSRKQGSNHMKLSIIAALGLVVGFVLLYGALRTAEQIAKPHVERIEAWQ